MTSSDTRGGDRRRQHGGNRRRAAPPRGWHRHAHRRSPAHGSAGGRGRPTMLAMPLDLAAGSLHSADRNPWREIAEAQGRAPSTRRRRRGRGLRRRWFPGLRSGWLFRGAAAVSRAARSPLRGRAGPSRGGIPRARRPLDRLADAVSTFFSGAELDRVSVHDFDRYEDTVRELARRRGLWPGDRRPRRRPAGRAELSGARASIGAANAFKWRRRSGAIAADAVIVTLPSNLLAEELLFTPALPRRPRRRRAAARPRRQAVPLACGRRGVRQGQPPLRPHRPGGDGGLSLPALRPADDRGYFAGTLGRRARGGRRGGLLRLGRGRARRHLRPRISPRRLEPLQFHPWGSDPYAAAPIPMPCRKADCRRPSPRRSRTACFFAGEACSRTGFSLRTAPISPASPPPSRQSPRGGDNAPNWPSQQ